VKRLVVLLAACSNPTPEPHVLLYSRTLGYRHDDAIAAALRVLPERLEAVGIATTSTEEPVVDFTPFVGVVFLYTSGDNILDPDGKAALEAFVRDGGGWLGVHSAADTEYAWPFYGELVVAPFQDHPAIQIADVYVEAHPALGEPPVPWRAEDEWYNFGGNPRDVAGVAVLATLDETSYTGGTHGADHPIIWAHETLGGRALYSGLGHVAARWDEPAFVDHMTAAVEWITRQR